MKNQDDLKIFIHLFCFMFFIIGSPSNGATIQSACEIPVLANEKYTVVVNRILNVIQQISSIRGDGEVSPIHKKFIGNAVDGEVYCKFLKDRISEIYISEDYGNTMSYHLLTDKVSISPNMQNKSDLHIMLGLIHEAHHGEGYDQSVCSKYFINSNGKSYLHPWSSLSACDDSSVGANGIGLVWVKNLQVRCTNCSMINFDQIQKYFDNVLYGGFLKKKSIVNLVNDFNKVLPENGKIALNPVFFED
jgi:hypothetical protein